MSASSSIATRVLACLVAVLVLGSGTVGLATAATGGSTSSETTSGPLGELTGTTAAVLETTVDGTTDTLENTTNETTGALEDATNETTDVVEGTVNETTDALENTTNETTGALEETVEETTTELENATDETNALLENATERVTAPIEVRGGVGVESDGSNVTVGTELEVAAASNDDAATEEDSSGDDADEGAGPAPPGGGSSGADAVLVGLLGAITASGAAAGSAGASAGAGAGASAGAGAASAGGAAAGSAASLVASWLSQLSQLPGLRHLRRVGSTLPWGFLPIFKYSRYDDSDPLENERRRAVYETIAADPGCYLSQVSDRSDVALSTVRHHVRVLEEEGLVTSAKLNGKRRYYLDADGDRPGDGTDVADAELHAALAEPAKREVLETLAALGTAQNGRLADELERDPSTVSHHLSALEDDGLVVREKDGRAVVNELAPDVEATLRDEGTPSEEEPAKPPMSAPADD